MEIDMKGHMLFGGHMRYGIKDWWMGTIALVAINVVGGIVLAFIPEVGGILSTLLMVGVVWASLGLWVARLRDRGKEGIMLALPIIIGIWGFVECAFLGSAE